MFERSAIALAGPVDVSRRAAEYIVTNVPIASARDTVGDVIASLSARPFELIDAIYVVDDLHRFHGAVSLPELFGAPAGRSIGELANVEFPRVGPHHEQEHVAAKALARNTSSVAVIDELGRFTGVVAAGSLLEILRREHVEDLHRLAGIAREDAEKHDALEGPPMRRARHRLPWLLVGLVGSMLAAFVMSRFERVLEQQVTIAFFVPAIVYLADAIGTQTEAVAVRGLSLSRLSLRHLLGGEIRTGLLIGVTLAILSFPIVSLMFHDAWLGFSVASAVLVAGGVATTTGLLLPWILMRLGSDPAFGSGPVATIIQDVLSILIYFAIVSRVMT